MALPLTGRGTPVLRQMIRTTTQMSTEPAMVAQQAAVFVSSLKGLSPMTLLLYRGDNELAGFLIANGAEEIVEQAALQLSKTIGARIKRVDELEDVVGELDTSQPVGWSVFDRRSPGAKQTQQGMNPLLTPKVLKDSIPVGGWVAITMRRCRNDERRRHAEWISSRPGIDALATHHSKEQGAIAVRLWAQGPDRGDVVSALSALEAALPGFDMLCRQKVATRTRTLLVPGLFLLLAVLGLIGAHTSGPVGDALAMVRFELAAAIAAAIGAGRWLGLLPSKWKRTQRMARTLRFPKPRAKPYGFLGKPPRKESIKNGNPVAGRAGDYPYPRSTFQVGPAVVVGLVAPTAGAASGTMDSAVGAVPSRVLDRIGPMIGHAASDSNERPVYLSASDAFGGIAVIGRAGAGKSYLTMALYAWSALDRARPCGASGFPGRNNTIVAFGSKGDEIADYTAWASAVGDTILPVDLGDDESWGIDLLYLPGATARERAEAFVSAMEYAFDPGEIQGRARVVLSMAITAGLVLTERPDLVSRIQAAGAPNVEAEESAIYYAHLICGGLGDPVARTIANEIMGAAAAQAAQAIGFGETIAEPGEELRRRDVRDAADALAPIFQGRTESSRRTETDSSQRKLGELLSCRGWWRPSRPKLTWDDIVNNHWAVVVNTGPSPKIGARLLSEDSNKRLAALLMFTLKAAINRNCNGRQREQRYITIVADELALLAGSSSSVITWLKDQGRSFGVRPILATQRPDQLTNEVRSAFLNFSTLISFAQESTATSNQIAVEIGGGNEEWTGARLQNLPPYTAVVRCMADGRRQEPYTARIADFVAQRHQFAQLQGWDTGWDSGLGGGASLTPATANPSEHQVGHQVGHHSTGAAPAFGQDSGAGQVGAGSAGELGTPVFGAELPRTAARPAYDPYAADEDDDETTGTDGRAEYDGHIEYGYPGHARPVASDLGPISLGTAGPGTAGQRVQQPDPFTDPFAEPFTGVSAGASTGPGVGPTTTALPAMQPEAETTGGAAAHGYDPALDDLFDDDPFDGQP